MARTWSPRIDCKCKDCTWKSVRVGSTMHRPCPKCGGMVKRRIPANVLIVESSRHGKAVKGTKKTSTIQVREYTYMKGSDKPSGYFLKGQFRFTVGDMASKAAAEAKAKKYAEGL